MLGLHNTTQLMMTNNIKLRLQHCNVVMTQDGRLLVVAKIFGNGYYGQIKEELFHPGRECTEEVIKELADVEERGMEAVQETGILLGSCCICGRALTDDFSIANGIGPICAGKFVGWGRNDNLEAI